MLKMKRGEERFVPGWVSKPDSEQDVSEIDSSERVAKRIQDNEY